MNEEELKIVGRLNTGADKVKVNKRIGVLGGKTDDELLGIAKELYSILEDYNPCTKHEKDIDNGVLVLREYGRKRTYNEELTLKEKETLRLLTAESMYYMEGS